MFKRLFISILALFVISACSTRKNSFTNRTYHKATAWFNTLFNGQEAMDTKLNELKQSHTDDYFKTLSVSPYGEFQVNDNAEAINYRGGQGISLFGQIASGNVLDTENSSRTGFEKAEEKALKAINNHSMMVRGEERNKLMALAYLMLGKARYYQGKPFQALEALNQVEQMPFEKHKATAKYYSALAQIQLGNNYAAAEILDPLYFNKDLKKEEKALIAQQYAELFYKEGNYESAINALEEAIKNTKSKKQRARLNYIEGQILTEIKDYKLANEKFLNAYKLNPGFEMEARAQVSKALNFQADKDNYSDFLNDLKGVLKKGTYQKYRNEFYYALGTVEEKRDSLNLAKKNYLQALKEEMSSPFYRAETFAALGNLYFNDANYVYANAYYDSAVASIPESKRKEELTEFSKNLNNVMKMHYLVMKNDSILNVASLAPAEQKDFFSHYIERLKKEDEKKTKEEEIITSNFQTQSKIKSF
ncbi:tetratricopeptide repeat protein, partial [Weeksellaceae bacterium TAE3-ERU29]|nr:tetratricopeptide repeat protein [Weeksellaceae bacterium TAE3-ERU29]